MELLARSHKCDGCAFNSGTAANRSELTLMTAKLCVETCEPFYCHEEVHELQKNGVPYSVALERANPPLCAGYIEAVEMLKAKGAYEDGQTWKREMKLGFLDLIQAANDGELADDDVAIQAELRRLVERVTARVTDDADSSAKGRG